MMLDKVRLHQKFSSWPLHVTIVSWFEIRNLEMPRFIAAIEKIIAGLEPIKITAANINYYGESNTIKVMELKPNDALSSLREKLIQATEACQAIPIETYKDFKPHVTFNKDDQSLEQNMTIVLTELLLVAKMDNNHNQIVEKFSLN